VLRRDDVVQLVDARAGISSVNTIANPPKIAPATKYGGKMVVCQPGMTDVAKSNDTTLCTESTSGVERPARSRYAIS
jgi:hydrogenase maturation factor HypE